MLGKLLGVLKGTTRAGYITQPPLMLLWLSSVAAPPSPFPGRDELTRTRHSQAMALTASIRVVGRVDLLNALGAMIAHRYVCDYKGGRAEVLSIRPR